uniref:DUF4926 domain-containing protein n=1 Tax=Schlesneria paludicola TaxID=360056 RepID=A0A7C2P557_9PLAN
MSAGFKELDTVVLLTDRPADGLSKGDVGAVVHIHPEGEIVEVEFVTWSGQTVALVTVPTEELRKLDESERMQSRPPVAAGK